MDCFRAKWCHGYRKKKHAWTTLQQEHFNGFPFSCCDSCQLPSCWPQHISMKLAWLPQVFQYNCRLVVHHVPWSALMSLSNVRVSLIFTYSACIPCIMHSSCHVNAGGFSESDINAEVGFDVFWRTTSRAVKATAWGTSETCCFYTVATWDLKSLPPLHLCLTSLYGWLCLT